MYDLSDGYQRKQAESVMPWITQSREDVVAKQVEQFAFLSKLQLKAAFSDTAEIVRILMLLGGRERLIYMNNVAMAGASEDFLADEPSMWWGINKIFDAERASPRFLLGYNDDEWFVKARDDSSHVRAVLENLAVSYIHLFPRLMLGKLDPRGGNKTRAELAKGAKDLVKSALEFCLSDAPDKWLLGAIQSIEGEKDTRSASIAPRAFGGPRA